MNCHRQRKFVRIVNFVEVALLAFMLMMTTITHSMVRKNSARGVTAAGCRMMRTNKTRATKLLDILAESLDNTDFVTDNVKPQLAHIANKHWVKRLTPAKLKPILDKHKQPANFSDVVNSRVNPEIWGQLSEGQLNAAKKASDLRQAINMQQAIQKVAFIILHTADSTRSNVRKRS